MNTNRKHFLQGVLAAGAAPWLSGCIGRGYAVNEKVRLACIGLGNQASHDIPNFAMSGLATFVAFCDTDMGAPHTLQTLALNPKAPRFRDFRKMFDACEDDIDAVTVITPDFSHFPAAMAAMKRGKAVFCEKPLSHTFREAQLMMDAAAHYGVVTQMGNQGHSGRNYFQMKEYVARGVIPQDGIAKLVAHMNYPRRWHKWQGKVSDWPRGEALPETLDWNAWLGTAAWHAYSHDFTQGEWRSWYDFGNGCLGDWGAHTFDTLHQFLELGLPTRVAISDTTGWNAFVFPMQDTLAFTFPATEKRGALELEWREGRTNLPAFPKGFRPLASNGAIPKSGGAQATQADKIIPGREIWMKDGSAWEGGSHASPLYRIGDDKTPDYAFDKETSNHYVNFLRAVRGEEEARSPFSVAGTLSQVFTLGCIAQRLNRSFDFDPVTKRIPHDAEADRLLVGAPPRRGWESFYEI